MNGSIKVAVRIGSGVIETEAGPTPVPGLCVLEDPEVRGIWNVCHITSGAAVAKVNDPEGALHIAIKLGPVCDWTMPGIALRKNRAIAQRVHQVLLANDALGLVAQSRIVTNAQLRETDGAA